jgi:hypothetical protein
MPTWLPSARSGRGYNEIGDGTSNDPIGMKDLGS